MPIDDPVVVVSPHLDDGVFGCGDLLAERPGSAVITVFAGGPRPPARVEPWDAAAGFRPGEDVVGARREEDRSALALLGAAPFWLDFWDSQYGRTPAAADLEDRLAEGLASFRPRAVFFPLGLFHSDHFLTHDACRALARRWPADWFVYEDAIYRRYPGHAPRARLDDLSRAGFAVEPVPARRAASEGKRRALACYASQLRALAATPGHPGPGDALAPEGHWRVVPC